MFRRGVCASTASPEFTTNGHSLRFLRISLPCLRDLGGLLIAGMEEEAVTQFQMFAGFELEAPVIGLLVEAFAGKGIRGEEPIGAHVPRRGEAEAGGVVQHGDADGFT